MAMPMNLPNRSSGGFGPADEPVVPHIALFHLFGYKNLPFIELGSVS